MSLERQRSYGHVQNYVQSRFDVNFKLKADDTKYSASWNFFRSFHENVRERISEFPGMLYTGKILSESIQKP